MTTTVDVPAVGPVDKRYLIPVVGAAAAFVGWRYYRANQSAPAADGPNPDGEFGPVNGQTPDVLGAIPGTPGFGAGDTTQPGSGGGVDGYGFNGTTNSEWSQYAAAQLQQSATWTYSDIVIALGNFLNGRPLSTLQQSIVQAAIAVAGYPPVGSHLIIPGATPSPGTTPLGNPARPTVTHITRTAADFTIPAVPGAIQYFWNVDGRAYLSSVAHIHIGGIKAGSSHHATVRAISASGSKSGTSATASFKTPK